MKRIILKPGEEKRILAGHPWVYDNEVARILKSVPGGFSSISAEELEGGELADVESPEKVYLGRAFVNPHSSIIARIYSPSKEGVDKGFFKRRFREALGRRFSGEAGPDPYRESMRLVFGEADFLPGLIIDRFVGWPGESPGLSVLPSVRPLTFDAVESVLGPPRSWLSVQFLSWGMDRRRDEILRALEEFLSRDVPRGGQGSLGMPDGIIERSGAKVRELEGLSPRQGLIAGSLPPGGIVIFENGLPFVVNPGEGQKTGHFLDQRENRIRAAAFAKGRILDLCAYTGGFGIHAARLGTARGQDIRITAVDASRSALDLIPINAELNGVAERITTVKADIFDFLPRLEDSKERFDLIILDPPAFAKSRSALEGALRGYREINLRAIRLLAPGGVLVTCSCSFALDEGRFKRLITEAAADAGRRLVQLDFRYQAPDHPILLGYDESLYLKCGYYRAL
ncbi:MAG: class I SAM-dependent rRNA methyltransferase [Spirochaetaceae bacterium]|nr:class I SAM-dependent rRNA methyltransferase [Spirochaetaceae bacterium]